MSKEYCNAIDDECAFPSLECKQCLHGKSEAKEETEMDKITTEMVEHICDNLCRYRTIASQELMDGICEDCKIGKFVCDILNKYNHTNDFSNSQCAKMLEKMQMIDKLYLEKCQEVNQLKEKQTPKKPDYEGDGYSNGKLIYDTWCCPSCNKDYEVDYDNYDYCPNCGQAIDWSTSEDA